MKKYIEGVGEVEAPKTFKERLKNFWYHYKWHSVVSLILVFALTVCMLQFCKKEEYDVHILYAGPYVIGKTVTESGEAEIETAISSFKRVVDDFNSDKKIKINLSNYLYMSAEESEAAGPNVDYSFLNNDKKSLEGALEFSEYYLCFISPSVYEAYKGSGEGGSLFINLEEFASYVSPDAFYAPNAIKLSSTGFYNLPGISSLPEDTLICIKMPSAIAAKSKEHQKHLSNAKEILKNILIITNNPLE